MPGQQRNKFNRISMLKTEPQKYYLSVLFFLICIFICRKIFKVSYYPRNSRGVTPVKRLNCLEK